MNASLCQRLRFVFCLAAMFASGEFAAAQPQEDPLKVQRGGASSQPPPPVQGGGIVQQQSRPFYLQAAVTALVCGGAVWTVCRSSRRQ